MPTVRGYRSVAGDEARQDERLGSSDDETVGPVALPGLEASTTTQTRVSRTTRLSVTFSALGGILFGMDLANWAGASNQEDFLRVFCLEAGYGPAASCLAGMATALPRNFVVAVGAMSACLQIGAALSALVLAPRLARRFGRRMAIRAGATIAIVGMLGMCIVRSVASMIAARLLLGAGVGCITYSLSMFLGEITMATERGRLTSQMQLFTVIGVVLAALLGTGRWPFWVSFASPILPAAVLGLGIGCVPESPRWLLYQAALHPSANGDIDTTEAAATLARLRDRSITSVEIQSELREIASASVAEATGQEVAWAELWESSNIRRRVLIATGLQWAQQLSGLNSIITFGSLFFRSAGLGELESLSGTLITDMAGLAGTVYLVQRIDITGRRSLLIRGASIMSLGWLGVGVVALIFPPPAGPTAGDTGSTYSSSLGLLVVALVCTVQVGFGIGWGAVPWVLPAEIFPMRIKEKAMATSVFSQYASNFLLLQLFPIVPAP